MAKNKGKYRSQQAETELPPAELVTSLSARVFQFLRPHLVKIACVVGGLVLVVTAISTYTWYRERREARATLAFGKVVDTTRGMVAKEPAPATTPPDPGAPPRFKTHKDRAEAALAALSRLESEHGSAEVASKSSLVKAGLLYDLGKHDEAAAEYRKFLAHAGDADLALVAREGIGYAAEAKALAQADAKARASMLDQALAAYRELQPDEKGSARDRAMYHQGRILALKGERGAAITLFKELLAKHAGTSLAPDIRNRLALLEEQK